MEKGYTLISPCFFGMEKMLANEIKNLGFEIVKTEDGRVTYKTDEYGIAKANMWLRCAERVHLKIAEFEAKSFDELFEGTKRINWAKYIPYGAQFPITKASSIKSKLYSIPDIQSIVKKAVVESLKKSYLETGLIKEDKEKYSTGMCICGIRQHCIYSISIFWNVYVFFWNISSRYACSQIYTVCNNIRNDFNIRLVRI